MRRPKYTTRELERLVARSDVRALPDHIDKAIYLVENFALTHKEAAVLCKVSLSRLNRALKAHREGREIGHIGRPRALTALEENTLVDEVISKMEEGETLTLKEISEIANEVRFDRMVAEDKTPQHLTSHFVSSFLARHPTVNRMLSSQATNPPETVPLDREKIVDWYENDLKPKFDEIQPPPHMIFNLTEVLLKCDFNRKVVVMTRKEHEAWHPADNVFYITLLMCMSSDGSSMEPLIVLPDPEKTSASDTLELHDTFWWTSTNNGCIEHFEIQKWIDQALGPYLGLLRGINEDPVTQGAILIHDIPHIDADIEALGKAKNAIFFRAPPGMVLPFDKKVAEDMRKHLSRTDIRLKQLMKMPDFQKQVLSNIKEVVYDASYIDNVIEGFRTTGIHPFSTRRITVQQQHYAVEPEEEPTAMEEIPKEAPAPTESTSKFVKHV